MKHYPSARKLSNDERKEVEELVKVKANTKHVRNLVVEKYGKLVTLKNIHNIKTRIRENFKGDSNDAQLVLPFLQN